MKSGLPVAEVFITIILSVAGYLLSLWVGLWLLHFIGVRLPH